MHVSRRLVAALVVAALSAVLLTGCSQDQQSAVDAAKQKVDEQTTQSQATVDEKLNAAQAKVKELSSAAGDLEARINGLQLNGDLQELQRKLTAAIGEAGDKKKAALDELSNSFNDLVVEGRYCRREAARRRAGADEARRLLRKAEGRAGERDRGSSKHGGFNDAIGAVTY